jgi:hypothetical protein
MAGVRMSTDTVTLRLRAERLDVAAHQGAYVWFTYQPHPAVSIFVHSGRLEYLTRPIPPDGVDPDEMPTLLRIERVWHALPAGTLVTVETGEIR